MMTGGVIAGRADVRVIVCTPGPGILNVMVLIPGMVLAKLIASRRDVKPSLAVSSAAVVTIKEGGSTLGIDLSALNSLVSPVVMFVAVAVTKAPGRVGETVTVKDALPLTSVVAAAVPRKVCPWPKPDGSAIGLS